MEFVVIAQYRARAGEEGRVEQALRKMVAPTRAEPGNLDYQVFRDPAQPAVFVLPNSTPARRRSTRTGQARISSPGSAAGSCRPSRSGRGSTSSRSRGSRRDFVRSQIPAASTRPFSTRAAGKPAPVPQVNPHRGHIISS